MRTVHAPPETRGDPIAETPQVARVDAGLVARRAVPVGLVAVVFALPVLVPLDYHAELISRAAIFGIVALSMNVLIGHLGHVSLGHQAFFGFGAFASAAITAWGLPFGLGIVGAIVAGALTTTLLGYAALRIRGANFAVVTLAFGVLAEVSLFQIGQLVAGVEASVPQLLEDSRAFAYLCLLAVTVAYGLDWRLMRTKHGRAMIAVRDSEDVARSFGISVRNMKLLGFTLSGALVGLAGALFGHQLGTVSAQHEFDLLLGITFVLMTVIGGPGNRLGVLIGGMSFGVMSDLLRIIGLDALLVPIVGAGFLVLVLTRFPGGIGQQIAPLQRWVKGGGFGVGALRRPPSTEKSALIGDGAVRRPKAPAAVGPPGVDSGTEVSRSSASSLRWLAGRRAVTLAAVAAVTAGFITIAFAWDSAAQLDWAPGQLPYVVSGGIFGVALIMLGGAMLVGQALSRAAVAEADEVRSIRNSIVPSLPQPRSPSALARFRPAPRAGTRADGDPRKRASADDAVPRSVPVGD